MWLAQKSVKESIYQSDSAAYNLSMTSSSIDLNLTQLTYNCQFTCKLPRRQIRDYKSLLLLFFNHGQQRDQTDQASIVTWIQRYNNHWHHWNLSMTLEEKKKELNETPLSV